MTRGVADLKELRDGRPAPLCAAAGGVQLNSGLSRLLRFVGIMAALGLGTLTALALAEAGVRMLSPQPPLLYQPDPALGWVHPPNLRVRYPGHSGPVEVQFNSRGLRDPEHSLAKPAGVRRVLVLGDSYMEAVDVEVAQAFAQQLQQRLDRPDHRVEVINAGIGGYGTDQEYLFLAQQGWAYEPDVVLLAFTVDNDVYDTLAKGYCRASGDDISCAMPPASTGRRLFTASKAFLQAHSQFYTFLYGQASQMWRVKRVMEWLGLTEYRHALHNDLPVSLLMVEREDLIPPELREGWKLTEAVLGAMQRRVAERGARFLILIVPNRVQVDEVELQQVLVLYEVPISSIDLENPNRKMVAFGRSHGVPVVDLLPVFREASRQGVELARGHWTAAGHALAADQAAGAVEQLLDDRGHP